MRRKWRWCCRCCCLFTSCRSTPQLRQFVRSRALALIALLGVMTVAYAYGKLYRPECHVLESVLQTRIFTGPIRGQLERLPRGYFFSEKRPDGVVCDRDRGCAAAGGAGGAIAKTDLRVGGDFLWTASRFLRSAAGRVCDLYLFHWMGALCGDRARSMRGSDHAPVSAIPDCGGLRGFRAGGVAYREDPVARAARGLADLVV